MDEEYNQRISNLAGELVKFEKKFNKKIINETSVIESIKNITKKYNEQGQDLILKSLEEQADFSPSKILNSTGEISKTVLTEAISYAVNTASNQGIDIITPQQSNNEKNTITTVTEGVLTIALINTMITNFEKLTPEERTTLRENYKFLDTEQRNIYDKGMLDLIDKTDLSEDQKRELKEVFTDDFHQSVNSILAILQKRYGKDFKKNFENISQSEITSIIDSLEISDALREQLKNHKLPVLTNIEEARQKRADLIIQRKKAREEGNLDEVERLNNEIEKIQESKEYKEWEKINDNVNIHIIEVYTDDFHQSINSILTILQKRYGEDFKENFENIPQSEINLIIDSLDVSDVLKEELKNHKLPVLTNIDKTRQQRADLIIRQQKAKKEGNIDEVKRLQAEIEKIETSEGYKKEQDIENDLVVKTIGKDNQNAEEYIQQEAQKMSQEVPVEELNKQKPEDKISQEIEQLPTVLGKSNFSQEEIQEALKIYKGTLESLELDDIEKYIEYINNGKKIEVQDEIKDFFIEDGISQEIAEILSKIDYNGQLFEILGNEQQRTDFFEQLEQLTQPTQKQHPIQDEHTTEYYSSQNETLQVDETAEKIAREVQARGGSSNDITKALVAEAEKRVTEQAQQPTPENQPKEEKVEQTIPPISESPVVPEEHTQEDAPLHEQEAIEKPYQNMAMVKPDNSFIGKVRRVFANMKDMKNKDNSKGFFARLGASFKTVFGNKEEYYEEQDNIVAETTPKASSELEKPRSFDDQLRIGVTQPVIPRQKEESNLESPSIPKGAKISEDKDEELIQ